MKKNKFFLLSLLIFLVFFIKSLFFLDPDFGWHVKMGEVILSSGIPKTDPFSYTMQNFPFIDHEWLVNVLIFKLYSLGGFFLLSLVFSFLALATLIIIFKTFKNDDYYSWALLFLAAGGFIDFMGVRPQILSWLFFSFLISILLSEKTWSKRKYFLPLIFLFWANSHGTFGLGIVILAVFYLLIFFQEKKVIWSDFLIILSSFGMTLINPYGLRLWPEIWSQYADNLVRFKITEWYPSFLSLTYFFWPILAIFLAIFWRYWQKYSLAQKSISLIILFLALKSIRQIPFFVVLAMPLIFKGINFFQKELLTPENNLRFQKAGQYFFMGSLVLFLIWSGIISFKYSALREDNYYPKKAVAFLKQNLSEGKVFSDYNWGGYLIWRLPEKKVFIDGRMPSWKQGDFSALAEYEKILTKNENWKTIFAQRKITTVLWPKASSTNLVDRLKQAGWQEIYQDKVAVILEKQ